MKKRPFIVIWIGMMIVIYLCKQTGVPIFGEPHLLTETLSYIEETAISVTGTIESHTVHEATIQYILINTSFFQNQKEIPIQKIIVTTKDQCLYPIGGRLTLHGSLDEIQGPGNPGEFDSKQYYACQEIYYSMWADQVIYTGGCSTIQESLWQFRESLKQQLQIWMGEETAGVLSSMLLGEKSTLTEQAKADYKMSGFFAVLVVSGLHVAFAGMGIFIFLLRIRIPQWVAAGISCFILVFYVILSGGAPSGYRALIMFVISLIARIARKSYDPINAAALSGILLLITRPAYLFYSGYQMSFAAVAGTIIVLPILKNTWRIIRKKRKWKVSYSRKRNELFDNAVLGYISLQLVLLPLIAYTYYELPLLGWIPNLLLLPLTTLVIALGILGILLSFAFPSFSSFFLFPVKILLSGFSGTLKLVRHLPGAVWICGKPSLQQVCIYYAVLIMLLYLVHRAAKTEDRIQLWEVGNTYEKVVRIRSLKKRVLICFFLLSIVCFLLFLRKMPSFSYTMLDVGQGDASVILASGKAFLIDGGSSNVNEVGKYRILPYLKYMGIQRVEGIFVTHPDSDHMNGVIELLELVARHETALGINKLFIPVWMKKDEDARKLIMAAERAKVSVIYLAKGDNIKIGDTDIKVLYPESSLEMDSKNNGSMVISVVYKEFSALLTGDLEGKGEESLLGDLTGYTCLKVGHHGSDGSSSAAFLQIVKPQIALISAPERSVYGHPHKSTIKRLTDVGSKIYVTKDTGAITIIPDQSQDPYIMKSL